jgi:hypothetical protein
MAGFASRLRRGSKKMQYLVEKYRVAHPDEGPSVRSDLVAEWALEEGLWRPIPTSLKTQLSRLISRSMRETYMFDPQHREVRANLPITEEVMTSEGVKRTSRWYPLFDAPPDVAKNSFQFRRKISLSGVVQLHLDFLSYNENNPFDATLDPLEYNFTKDIEELEQPTTYMDEAEAMGEVDEEDDDEDDGEGDV